MNWTRVLTSWPQTYEIYIELISNLSKFLTEMNLESN